MNIDSILEEFLIENGVNARLAGVIDELILLGIILVIAFGVNYIGKNFIIRFIKRLTSRTEFQWDDLMESHNVFKYLVRILPALIILMLLPVVFDDASRLAGLIRKLCGIYIIFSALQAINGVILAAYDNYNLKLKTSQRPMRGFVQVIQVVLFFVGAIILISVIINKSPATLLAGLGASAAIFSLVFKDLLTGFIAGVQLSLNDMIRPGDWVTLNDNKTDGIVQEITLITVKIKNFDNSIATVPPTVLLTNTFKNWREMLEADGRLVMKTLYIDKSSIGFSTPEVLSTYRNEIPSNAGLSENESPTNTQLFRYYMENYLMNRKDINQKLGLKIGELEVTDRGLPIQFFFFTKEKGGLEFERDQSDIMDHAIAMLPKFNLKIN